MNKNKTCFIECCSAFKQKNTSFHCFPTDPELCDNWCQSIKTFNKQENAINFHSRSYVCGHHFLGKDKYTRGRKTMLHKNVVPCLYPRMCALDQQHNEPQGYDHEPMVVIEEGETNKFSDENSYVASDQEDFFGFNADDLKKEILNETTDDQTNTANKIEPENDASRPNPLDSQEFDDEIIFVENNVEVIEIDDDDDDDETPQTAHIKQDKKQFSKDDIQKMVIANHPQVQLRKPKLDWKSDQFRVVYINGENQNCCTCTKCGELFEEMNIDNVVRHAKCNPTPSVSPSPKRRKVTDQQELEDIFESSLHNLTISKIQTLAACKDIQTATFYQRERFLQFAQFLVDSGANCANKHKIEYETTYGALCSYRDELRSSQSSKVWSILNGSTVDFSLSCEIWVDIFRSKTNVSLEMHYLNDNFVCQRSVIGVRSINGIGIEDITICDRILDILNIYAAKNNGAEFLQKATAFVTSRILDARSLGIPYFPSACSIINEIANGIINENRLKLAEKCLHVIGWLNSVSTKKITEFDARKWENIFELFKDYTNKRSDFVQSAADTVFPRDYSILQLLEPFYNAIVHLSDTQQHITKVFGVFNQLESNLMPLESDEPSVKYVKRKAVASLRTAFADSDIYQICMFLDPSNRDQYNSLESDKMDSLQSKIDLMIHPYMSTKENGGVENDLIHYMDDTVTSQPNQIELFLQWSVPSKHNPFEFWRDNVQMPGLRTLARKYFSIPTFVSRSECKFSTEAAEFLAKRNTLEVKDMETILMMNSQIDVDLTNFK